MKKIKEKEVLMIKLVDGTDLISEIGEISDSHIGAGRSIKLINPMTARLAIDDKDPEGNTRILLSHWFDMVTHPEHYVQLKQIITHSTPMDGLVKYYYGQLKEEEMFIKNIKQHEEFAEEEEIDLPDINTITGNTVH